MPKYVARLSVSDLEALKRDLIAYRDDLPNKCEKIVSRLLNMGVGVANAKVGESPLGKHIVITTNISKDSMGCDGILLAKGDVKYQEGYAPFSILLAVEFGAGQFYNKNPNPLINDKFPFGVGTFPGQTHAFQDTWFYWDIESQKWRPTHGVKATMPMHNALITMQSNLLNIAKLEFGE